MIIGSDNKAGAVLYGRLDPGAAFCCSARGAVETQITSEIFSKEATVAWLVTSHAMPQPVVAFTHVGANVQS